MRHTKQNEARVRITLLNFLRTMDCLDKMRFSRNQLLSLGVPANVAYAFASGHSRSKSKCYSSILNADPEFVKAVRGLVELMRTARNTDDFYDNPQVICGLFFRTRKKK